MDTEIGDAPDLMEEAAPFRIEDAQIIEFIDVVEKIPLLCPRSLAICSSAILAFNKAACASVARLASSQRAKSSGKSPCRNWNRDSVILSHPITYILII